MARKSRRYAIVGCVVAVFVLALSLSACGNGQGQSSQSSSSKSSEQQSAQMFEEFYETYDVKEGDGMYLAPEERIALW